jgi:ribosomal protein L18E
LGKGELKSKIDIIAVKWSKSAEAAIIKAGGVIKDEKSGK